MGDDEDLLWHYTDAAGLLGIVENRELWASDVAFLNDEQELGYARGCFMREVLRRAQDEAGELDEDTRSSFLTAVNDFLRVLPLSAGWAFVACFCEKADRLSQWRGYGAGGFAVGFDPDALAPDGWDLKKVEYGPGDGDLRPFDVDLVRTTIDFWLVNDFLMAEEGEPRGSLLSSTTSLDEMWAAVVPQLAHIKHDAFDEEHEWRLIMSPDDLLLPVPGVKHRTAAVGLIPYVPITVKYPMIRRIVVGPGPHPQVRLAGAEQLKRNTMGLGHVEITGTNVPLRI